jgi:NADH-quinone oxidoreductase subunit L
VGFLGIPVIGPFQDWITVPGHEHHGFSTFYNLVLPVGSVAVALLGIGLGYLIFYKEKWRYDILAGPFAWAYRFVENKYFLDDLYLNGVVNPTKGAIARAAYWSNQHILDGAVNKVAAGTVATSKVTYDVVDQQVVDYAVNGAAGITGLTGGVLRYIQTGNVQRYAAILFAAVVIFVLLLVLL